MASNKTETIVTSKPPKASEVMWSRLFHRTAITWLQLRAAILKAGFAPSPNLALVDGDIGQAATAANIAQTAISKFGSIDASRQQCRHLLG